VIHAQIELVNTLNLVQNINDEEIFVFFNRIMVLLIAFSIQKWVKGNGRNFFSKKKSKNIYLIFILK